MIRFFSIIFILITHSACRHKGRIENKLPKYYSNGGRFFECIKKQKEDNDSIAFLKFYDRNGKLQEMQEIEFSENGIAYGNLTKKTIYENEVMAMTIMYSDIYHTLIEHNIGDDGWKWEQEIVIKEFYPTSILKSLTKRKIYSFSDDEHYTIITDSVNSYFETGRNKEVYVLEDGAYKGSRKIYNENGILLVDANFSE